MTYAMSHHVALPSRPAASRRGLAVDAPDAASLRMVHALLDLWRTTPGLTGLVSLAEREGLDAALREYHARLRAAGGAH